MHSICYRKAESLGKVSLQQRLAWGANSWRCLLIWAAHLQVRQKSLRGCYWYCWCLGTTICRNKVSLFCFVFKKWTRAITKIHYYLLTCKLSMYVNPDNAFNCAAGEDYFWGSKITADEDCSHEIKRHLLLGRKVMTNLGSILKSRDIILPTKVCLIKAFVSPVVMYGCESWTIKKAERRRTDPFELWYWRRLLRVPWSARSNKPMLKEISPEYSFEALMLKLKL